MGILAKPRLAVKRCQSESTERPVTLRAVRTTPTQGSQFASVRQLLRVAQTLLVQPALRLRPPRSIDAVAGAELLYGRREVVAHGAFRQRETVRDVGHAGAIQ